MLKKIIRLKNVGRFKGPALHGNLQLLKHVLILGANGSGKTTLCAVLRSLQTGEPDYVIGRRTLGVADMAEIDLLTDNGNVRFNGTSWNRTMPNIAIFDGTFVAENVHSGDVVGLDHKRSLYRVIVGQEGVALAEEEAQLAVASRAKTSDIGAAGSALQAHIPVGVNLQEFLGLDVDPNIDMKIAEQTKTVGAIRQAEQIKTHMSLSELKLPALSDDLEAVLTQTIEDIAADAEDRVAVHLAAHQMADHGEAWLADGMPYVVDDKCPFCGQDVEGVSLIAAYRSLFSEAYRQLKTKIGELRATVARDFGDSVIGRFTTQVADNRAHLGFWKDYCTLDWTGLELSVDIEATVVGLRCAALALLDRKVQTPIEPVAVDSTFTEALLRYSQVRDAVSTANTSIHEANAVIAAKKTAIMDGNVKAAEAVLSRLRAIQKRHEPQIAEACTAYSNLKAEKDALEGKKAEVRAKLEGHTKKVVKPYETRINALLTDFNAGFQITETKHTYPGGVATSSYHLVINSTSIDVGDGKTPLDQPSFKNTLSAGDRSTLALVFFLAHLERDPDLANRIVVFDDPFSSQDAFRRQQTVFEIKNISQNCAQIIVLSHDAGFLLQVWNKCPVDQRLTLQLTDHRSLGSRIGPCDIEEACKGRMASELDDLLLFEHTGAGKPRDIVKKMRIVLETYCRTAYPGLFDQRDMLGSIIQTIRKSGDQHPAYDLLKELDQINDYSREHHHGEDPTDGIAEQLDDTELNGYVRRTLKIANALQA